MAYAIGYERFTGSIDGRPVEEVTVRSTHVYRREDGEWKIVHRHGDNPPVLGGTGLGVASERVGHGQRRPHNLDPLLRRGGPELLEVEFRHPTRAARRSPPSPPA